MCKQMEPFFAYFLRGLPRLKDNRGEKLQLKKQSLAMGLMKLIGTVREICSAVKRWRVDLMEQMQLAESRVCSVDTFTTKAEPYSFDLASGKWISSEIVDGICDQYVYTEVITLDEFGLGTIEKYEVKKTFIQQRLKGADREFACDLPGEWDDKVYVSKQVYFPMSCVSLVRN